MYQGWYPNSFMVPSEREGGGQKQIIMWFAGINLYMYVHEDIYIILCVCVEICRAHMCQVDTSIGCGSNEARCVEVYVDYRDIKYFTY